MNEIERAKAFRLFYLKQLCELSGNNTFASIPLIEINEKLGWDDTTCDAISTYLNHEALIDFPTFGTVSITHAGVKAIEKALNYPLKSTPGFPALVELPRIFLNPKTEDNKPSQDNIHILFLAADPTDASRLRLGEEFREIQEKLRLSKERERFELHPRFAVRPEDFSQALLDLNPQVIHFSGHGTASGELCFENQVGGIHPIEPDALASLFEQFANQVNCVILNACYSEVQALAIAKHIKYVIGMNKAIGDKSAIAFSIGFYQALGAGRSIEDAYKLGCVQIRLQGIPEHLTPVLVKNNN